MEQETELENLHGSEIPQGINANPVDQEISEEESDAESIE